MAINIIALQIGFCFANIVVINWKNIILSNFLFTRLSARTKFTAIFYGPKWWMVKSKLENKFAIGMIMSIRKT